MRRQWRRFLATLPTEPVFLHRDEFAERYPALSISPPAVMVEAEDGRISLCLDAGELARCASVDALQTLITDRCLNKERRPAGA